MSHGFQVGASYTYSHALDEQSGLGLFYNGNNPLNLRDGYASADFDRTHVINFNYVFQMPDLIHEHNLASYFANGWSLVGLTVLQSGQPYSVIDFSGAVGSIYYSHRQRHHQPHRSAGHRLHGKNAKTGHSGAFGDASSEVRLLHRSAASQPGGLQRRHSRPPIPTRPTSPPASATSSASPSRSAPTPPW